MPPTATVEPNLLEHKIAVPVSVRTKVLDASDGVIEAIVSVTNNMDEGGDVILPGAHDYGLTTMGVMPKGVASHDWTVPIARTKDARELKPKDSGLPGDLLTAGFGALVVTAEFNLKTQAGSEAFETVRFFEDEQQYSIGYESPDAFLCGPDFDPTKQWATLKPKLPEKTIADIEARGRARFLPKVIDWEWSTVLWGMNLLTRTTAAKLLGGAVDLEPLAAKVAEHLREHITVTTGNGATITTGEAKVTTPPDAKLWLDADDVLGPDTFEARQAALCDAVNEWAHTTFGPCWCSVQATWQDRVMFYVEAYDPSWLPEGEQPTDEQTTAVESTLDDDRDGFFLARYTIGADNAVTLDAPEPATVQVTIAPAVPKTHRPDYLREAEVALAYLGAQLDGDRKQAETKVGRAIARRNADRLEQMSGAIDTMREHVDAMLTEAKTEADAADAEPATDGADEAKGLDALAVMRLSLDRTRTTTA